MHHRRQFAEPISCVAQPTFGGQVAQQIRFIQSRTWGIMALPNRLAFAVDGEARQDGWHDLRHWWAGWFP